VVVKGTATLGTVTEKYATLEIPPPGAGFVTVIEAVVAEAVSEAEMLAVTCDSLTSLVGRGLPFQFTTEPETKPVPLTVSVNPGPPGTVADGTNGALTKGTRLAVVPANPTLEKTNPAITKRILR
jgi:hypothetical protein